MKINISKHIAPKLFSPGAPKKSAEINILQVKSCESPTDLFTKSLPISMFRKYVHRIAMQRIRDLQEGGGVLFS